jgi:hypothetical protein
MTGDDNRTDPPANRQRMIAEFRDARLRRSHKTIVPAKAADAPPGISNDLRDLMRLDTDKDDAAVTNA